MEPRFHTPRELVDALHNHTAGARQHLWKLLRQPFERLMGEIITRNGLREDRELLTVHALHAAETALRARPAAQFGDLSWNAFRAALILQIARVASQPHGSPPLSGLPGLPPLPDSPEYASETFFRPYTRVGNAFFGGDYYAGRQHDGSLWVLLADVTGHGYYAYLVASSLPALWQRCWSLHPDQPPEPAELLHAMHDMIADCMPEGVYVECTLARLDAEGRVTVSAAGGIRLMLRHGRHRPDLLKLRGSWLGVSAPTTEKQKTLELEDGDELMLATDGIFDQLEDKGGPEAVARQASAAQPLFEVVRRLVEESLASGPQKDDLTMVLLRKRGGVKLTATLPFPSSAHAGSG